MIAWVLLLVPITGGVGFIAGWSLNVVAFILAIVAMLKHGAGAGIWQLVVSLVVTPIIAVVSFLLHVLLY